MTADDSLHWELVFQNEIFLCDPEFGAHLLQRVNSGDGDGQFLFVGDTNTGVSMPLWIVKQDVFVIKDQERLHTILKCDSEHLGETPIMIIGCKNLNSQGYSFCP